MRVGISLLTLVPGVVGARDLRARACAGADRVGELEYRVFTPSVDDIEGVAIRSYRAERRQVAVRAMAQAAVAPGGLQREMQLAELDAIHFPLTVMLPRVDPPAVVSLLDIQHVFFRSSFPARSAVPACGHGASLQRARAVIAISGHVKETLVERMGVEPERVAVIHLGLDHDTFRPGTRGSGAAPPLPGEPVASQEPPAALRGVRAVSASPA